VVIPTFFDITRSPALIPIYHSVSRLFEQTFQDGFFLRFRTPVLLSKRRSNHRLTVIYSSFSRLFSEKFDGFVFSSHFRRFWRHLIRRSLCFALAAVLLLSSTPATVPLSHRYWRHPTHRSLCFVLSVLLLSSTPATVSQTVRST